MKNHFYISYFGNKRNEVEQLYDNIDFNNINTIIEPYCGTGALSFYIASKHPKQYKYILNDNNRRLYEMFNMIKIINECNKFDNDIIRTLEFIDGNEDNYYEIIKKNDLIGWFIKHRFYNIRPGLFPTGKTMKFTTIKNYPIYNFFINEDITFLNNDALDVYNEYKNKDDVLIFLDPPYLGLCNDFYLNTDINIYEYLFNNNISKEKAKIYLILENNWIIKLLFKNNNILLEYDKKYQTTKKNTSHIIIYNK